MPAVPHAPVLLALGTMLTACAVSARPPVAALPQLAPATPAQLALACQDVPAALAGLSGTTITAAVAVAAGAERLAGQPVPAHCRVTGRSAEHVSPVDGKTYAIQWELRLPEAWNGRFFHQGNGGIDGAVVPATGALGGGPRTGALMQGFAVLSSDAGHANAQGGPAFGIDPQARLDYGWQAAAKLTPIAKQALALAYGKGPDRSYFGGCSNGGRHTLVAAARMPGEYDGYLAGAPGYRLPLAALANVFGAQRYASVASGDPRTAAGLETAFTRAERQTVVHAVLARCDALDGAVDGLVQDTATCQRRFEFMRDVPTCRDGVRDGSCLTQAQKLAIAPIFRGATTRSGERFYSSFPFDTGLATGGVAQWEFTAPLERDSGALAHIFTTPPQPVAGTDLRSYVLNLDIDAALAQLHAADATYTSPSMAFMTPPAGDGLNLLRARGAKMLVYHGVSDAIFSVTDTERWYHDTDHASGGRADQFVRLYRVPGMGHCSGGPSTDQVDWLGPLVRWVEQGEAPAALTATARGAGNPGGVNADVPADWAADRTRPLCPYPSVATYRGQGSLEQASSFACVAPRSKR